jgi:hypothetical protein
LQGILYDKYHKIPKPEGNKLKPNWKPDYLILLEKANNYSKFMESLKEEPKSTSKNPLALMGWRLDKSMSAQGAPCAICGSYEDVQMHHVKAIKDMETSKNVVHNYKITIQGKQIPLCRKHHLLVHKGD